MGWREGWRLFGRVVLSVCLGGLLLGVSLVRAGAQPSGGLFTLQPSFNSTNHLVSVSVFHWFTATGGQLSGPWRPVEGRANWTGTTNFWRTQLKQMMAANVDMLYVHVIPTSEQQRTNLIQPLNQLRSEGSNVPMVAPSGRARELDRHDQLLAHAAQTNDGGQCGHALRPCDPHLRAAADQPHSAA